MGKTLDYKNQVRIADLSQEFRGVIDERGRQVGVIAMIHSNTVVESQHCLMHRLDGSNVGDTVWQGYVHAARVVGGKLTSFGACNPGYIEFSEKDVIERVEKAIADCKKRYERKYGVTDANDS